MTGKTLKNSLILVFFVALTCFRTRNIDAAAGANEVKNETLVVPSQQFPNKELESVQHPPAAGWNSTSPKNLVLPVLSQGAFVFEERPSLKILLVKTSSLRVKEYLLHIHPSHHFW